MKSFHNKKLTTSYQTIQASEDSNEHVKTLHGSVLSLLRGHIYNTYQNPQFHMEKVVLMTILKIMILMMVKVIIMLSKGVDGDYNLDQSNIEFESLR